MDEAVWHKIMYGLSMRSYKEVVQQFADAYGISTVQAWGVYVPLAHLTKAY